MPGQLRGALIATLRAETAHERCVRAAEERREAVRTRVLPQQSRQLAQRSGD